MAGDWIKMRTDLFTHPKIVRILSATKTDKFRVVGGLHAVWTVFDTHSADGVLKGYTPELLDHVIGWDGFSRAMESVGWLLFDGLETLSLPDFATHNGQSAKRRAEDQKRKKTSRQSVREVSAEVSDKMRTREEKSREEKKEQKKTPSAAPAALPALPEWVPVEAWSGFVAMRKHERHSLTPRAAKLVLNELGRLRDAGADPGAVLDQSTRNGWRDVFPIREQQKLRAVSNGYQPLPGEV